MNSVIITGDVQRETARRLVDAAPIGAVVSVQSKGETRTAAQNRTLHMWYGQIAKHQGDLDALDVKGMCHRRWGLAIKLRDRKFAWLWERSGAGLPYEKQCALLASGLLNVSSSMTTDELSEYLDGMARHFRAQGVHLTDPELRKWEAAA